MKVLEIRRHTERKKPGQHLTKAGVALARRVGAQIGPFHFVITSPVPRAVETAIAMGFATDGEEDLIAELGADVDREISWQAGFGPIAGAVRSGGAAAALARSLRRFCDEVIDSLPEDGSGLIISHGGLVEIMSIACLPGENHTAWGPACGFCEGVRLFHNGTEFVKAEMLRLEGSM
jgi:broad specificity phosphatase PhoE